jgi:Flp pilus assembly pilin Flp
MDVNAYNLMITVELRGRSALDIFMTYIENTATGERHGSRSLNQISASSEEWAGGADQAKALPTNDCFERNKRTEGRKMDMLRKLYVKADGFARGQTMAEYALILAAVAVVVFVGYQTMGTTITTMLSGVDTEL